MAPNLPESRDTHRELAAVRIGVDGLAEMDGRRRLTFIPRDKVHRVELVYTSGAERPMLTGALGIVALLMGLFPFALLFLLFARGGSLEIHVFWLSALGVLGVWLIHFAIRSRYVLLVHTSTEKRKLVFHRSAAREDVVRFVTEAAPQFQYPLSVTEELLRF